MKRWVSLVALVAVGALVAVACDTLRPVAFEVNGAETTRSSLERELRAIADNEVLAEGGVSQTDGTLTSQATAFWLTLLVQQEVIDRAVERRGVAVTSADRDASRADIEEQFGPGAFDAFPQWFRERISDRFSRRHALIRELGDAPAGPTDEEVQATFDQQLAELEAQCPSGKFGAHILVETREQADMLRAQLVAGANFTELARTESTDTGSGEVGGQLGCFDATQFVPEFSTAADALPLGQVSEPVETEFGFHLILMSDTIPFEALEEQIRNELAPATNSTPKLAEMVAKAKVEVDPRYGTWKVQEGEGVVLPPQPATTATDPAPAPAP